MQRYSIYLFGLLFYLVFHINIILFTSPSAISYLFPKCLLFLIKFIFIPLCKSFRIDVETFAEFLYAIFYHKS